MLTPLDANQWDHGKAAHLLNRAGFGGSPEEIRAIHQLGLKKAVEHLLNGPDDSSEFPKPSEVQPTNYFSMKAEMKGLTEAQRMEKFKELLKQERQSGLALLNWWMQRMRRTDNPAREKLTLFWHGHFATSVQKVKRVFLMWQQNETLRRNALGDFRVMVKEISHDPAMMFYLDTNQSNKDHPNENFARELMELFTLGIGNYTEHDIQEAARAFTGYRISPEKNTFIFMPFMHDDGPKEFLGKKGKFGGDEIVEIILQQPACAKFITKKLWSFYAYENPSPALAEALATSFSSEKYAIRPLLRKMFLSKEFYSEAAIRTQIKSPVQWMVETAKVLETDLPNQYVMSNLLNQLGQVPFMPPNVKGWDGGKSWITTSTLLQRYNMSNFALGHGSINLEPMKAGKPGKFMAGSGKEVSNATPPRLAEIAPSELREDPDKLLEKLGWRIYQSPLQPDQKTAFLEFLKTKPAPVTDETLRDLLHLMMSTPQYQLT